MMSDEKTIENAIKNAAASVEMEGYHIDEQSKEWCHQLLRKEISVKDTSHSPTSRRKEKALQGEIFCRDKKKVQSHS